MLTIFKYLIYLNSNLLTLKFVLNLKRLLYLCISCFNVRTCYLKYSHSKMPNMRTSFFDKLSQWPMFSLFLPIWTVQSNGEPAYRVRTPRLGRSIDSWRILDGEGAPEESIGGQFVQRMAKKSVPFKPRLGKRAQVCGGDWVTTRTRGHATEPDGGRSQDKVEARRLALELN